MVAFFSSKTSFTVSSVKDGPKLPMALAPHFTADKWDLDALETKIKLKNAINMAELYFW